MSLDDHREAWTGDEEGGATPDAPEVSGGELLSPVPERSEALDRSMRRHGLRGLALGAPSPAVAGETP